MSWLYVQLLKERESERANASGGYCLLWSNLFIVSYIFHILQLKVQIRRVTNKRVSKLQEKEEGKRVRKREVSTFGIYIALINNYTSFNKCHYVSSCSECKCMCS